MATMRPIVEFEGAEPEYDPEKEKSNTCSAYMLDKSYRVPPDFVLCISSTTSPMVQRIEFITGKFLGVHGSREEVTRKLGFQVAN